MSVCVCVCVNATPAAASAGSERGGAADERSNARGQWKMCRGTGCGFVVRDHKFLFIDGK